MNHEAEQLFQQALNEQNAAALSQAEMTYKRVLQLQPQRLDAMHNLAIVQLHRGQMKPAVALMEAVFAASNDGAALQGTAKAMAMALYQQQYWEQAKPWLLRAVQQNPDDHELARVLERISARTYLAPEVYDAAEDKTLLRFSPREASSYVYSIDIVGTCNLRCPSCPVGNSAPGARSSKIMSLAVFKQVLDKIDQEKPMAMPQIWLFNWGEPLLHPELPALIHEVKKRGYSCHLSSNLNTKKGLREMIQAQPDELKISLSGFSDETYSLTHARGELELVKENLNKLRQYIDEFDAKTSVWVSHHLYKNNAHQADTVQAMASKLNFSYHGIQAFYQPLEKLMSIAQADVQVLAEPILDNLIVPPQKQIAFSKAHQQQQMDCELRFNQTVINADATVAQCCSQYNAENMLGLNFLEHDHKSIEAKKYNSELCKKCRAFGLDYAPRTLADSLAVGNE